MIILKASNDTKYLVDEKQYLQFVCDTGYEAINRNKALGLLETEDNAKTRMQIKVLLLGVSDDVARVFLAVNKNRDIRVDYVEREYSNEELLKFAAKHGLFIKIDGYCHSHEVATSLVELAKCMHEEYGECAFKLVDVAYVMTDKYKTLKELKSNISRIWNDYYSNLEATDEKLKADLKVYNIKPDFCFSDYTRRFKSLAEVYEEGRECSRAVMDFWCGTDMTVGYSSELDAMYKAIKAQESDKQYIKAEVSTDYKLSVYNFLVSELLGQERVNLLHADFEHLKGKHREYFDSLFDKDMRFKVIYSYLCKHMTEEN